ncbi:MULTISPECIES: SAF domain-containing protein [unclassified Knoellia]|uniref:SAF domain-containing protein n=1 Tax=Knoellia altitudinis TaxID=3404795 RepID=UPI00361DA328
MPRLRLPSPSRPELLGPSRRARWRRWALRRTVAVACAVAALLALVGIVRPPSPATTTVLVAARALPAGTVLTASDVRSADLESRPRAVGAVGAVADPDELVGRRLASRVQVGEVLTVGRLVPQTPADGLPTDHVAAHVLLADERSLDLVSAGQRVTLFADTGGSAVARDVLVLGVDTPDDGGLPTSLPGSHVSPRGLVIALSPTALDQVFAGQRPDGGPPRVLAVVTG